MEEVSDVEYDAAIEQMRHTEYPMLEGTTYLDHAGTTLYAKSFMQRFSADMIGNLFGNPHSSSISSQLTTQRIEDVRVRLLGMFKADPTDFDVVFVANATAGIKLVMEAFRDHDEGYWYGFHRDAHTSVIGVRETAAEHRCFSSDVEVEDWIEEPEPNLVRPSLFAYPAQSNMNGRRLSLDWPRRIRESKNGQVLTLLDAAALVSTSPLDLSEANSGPDFVVLSLYKIFGFPDLGAVLVRHKSGFVFDRRHYFGGGTVEMVTCSKEQWHAKKESALHARLEDGTLPVHSILALDAAMDIHTELFRSMEAIAKHTTFLSAQAYRALTNLKHGNGSLVCKVYTDPIPLYGNVNKQGPVIAFNLRDCHGAWVSNAEVEKLAAIRHLHIRTGGLCNPGGIAAGLDLEPWELKANFSAGQRCSNDDDIIGTKPTGMIRVSFGAMSTTKDVDTLTAFLREFFVQEAPMTSYPPVTCTAAEPPTPSRLHVESLSIYPIKSCGAFSIPSGKAWSIRREGLAWDREWLLVHQGTGHALSQKRYPKMALLRPSIDLEAGVLRVRLAGSLRDCTYPNEIAVPLSANPNLFSTGVTSREACARVCGDSILAKTYVSKHITTFFSQALGVACHLARFPVTDHGITSTAATRHSKPHLQSDPRPNALHVPGAFPDSSLPVAATPKPLLLSNESPILTISRASLNRLNELIKAEGGKAAEAEVFRANIVVAEHPQYPPGAEQPYAEDAWSFLRIGTQYFEMLGPCRRCQMICVDQYTAERNQEPFITLSKTRRIDGRVYFGTHTCHVPTTHNALAVPAQLPVIAVGDPVRPFTQDDAIFDEVLGALHP